jgi:SAM-dependent methyltransferase
VRRWEAEQLRAYWEHLHGKRGAVGDLDIVCLPDAPVWLNRYVEDLQRRAFDRALRHFGRVTGRQVLDVGCGTGRWSLQLRDRGAEVLGIDISEAAIEANRRRIVGVEFRAGDIAGTPLPTESFDLAVSVTVLQHLPHAAQEIAIQNIASALRPTGTALILENVRDQGPHVFARPIDDWVAAFRHASLSPVYVSGYSYDIPLRLAELPLAAWGGIKAGRRGHRINSGNSNLKPGLSGRSAASMRLRFYVEGVERPLAAIARLVEHSIGGFLPLRWATHAAFLFTKVTSTH